MAKAASIHAAFAILNWTGFKSPVLLLPLFGWHHGDRGLAGDMLLILGGESPGGFHGYGVGGIGIFGGISGQHGIR